MFSAWLGVWLLCATGIVLSALSISGTWLVTLAALIAMLLSTTGFPGWWTIVLFLLLSGAVEGVEALAGAWGVRKRGGSAWAGFAALFGGLLGLFLGTLIPIPLIGSLLGMLIGSFAFAFGVERVRLKHAGKAAHIAWGAVVARLLILLLKLGVTMGMVVYIVVGMLMH
jgi:hypothetical protein